jgi:hypothetical protein
MGKDAERAVVVRGTSLTIEYAVRANGSMPARQFIEGLSKPDQRKLVALFQRMADRGNVPNREQFKQVRGDIFEFKKHQVRVFCFRKRERWLLTNGYRKKKDPLDQNEVGRAEQIMTEHLAREV